MQRRRSSDTESKQPKAVKKETMEKGAPSPLIKPFPLRRDLSDVDILPAPEKPLEPITPDVGMDPLPRPWLSGAFSVLGSGRNLDRGVVDLTEFVFNFHEVPKQSRRNILRQYVKEYKLLGGQIDEDVSANRVDLRAPIGKLNSTTAVCKCAVIKSPELMTNPSFVAASIQTALHILDHFCPHFARPLIMFRGGPFVPPTAPRVELAEEKEWRPSSPLEQLMDDDIDIFGAESPGSPEEEEVTSYGEPKIPKQVPILYHIEEHLDGGGHEAFVAWAGEALELWKAGKQGDALKSLACWFFQVVYALHSGQQWLSFAHNDLHYDNVMLRQETMPGGAWVYQIQCRLKDQMKRRALVLPEPLVRGRRVVLMDFELSYVEHVRVTDHPRRCMPKEFHEFQQILEGRDDDGRAVHKYMVSQNEMPRSLRRKIEGMLYRDALQAVCLRERNYPGKNINDLPRLKLVAGYDIATYIRHEIPNNPPLALVLKEEPENNFVDFIAQAAGINVEQITTSLDKWKEGDTPSLGVSLRPTKKEQEGVLDDPDYMLNLLSHPFILRLMLPRTSFCAYAGPHERGAKYRGGLRVSGFGFPTRIKTPNLEDEYVEMEEEAQDIMG